MNKNPVIIASKENKLYEQKKNIMGKINIVLKVIKRGKNIRNNTLHKTFRSR